MATINFHVDLEAFSRATVEQLKSALNPESAIRPALLLQIVNMHKRIHVDGQASDGGQIGIYSKGYMAVRNGVFQNSPRFVKGVNKGKVKNAGVFTAGINPKKPSPKVGLPRPNFHRGPSTKVIISLTRQLESDYAGVAGGPPGVFPSDNGKGYGIGFHNQHNYDKSQWVEATYSKPIFDMTAQEEKAVLDLIEENINNSLNG